MRTGSVTLEEYPIETKVGEATVDQTIPSEEIYTAEDPVRTNCDPFHTPFVIPEKVPFTSVHVIPS